MLRTDVVSPLPRARADVEHAPRAHDPRHGEVAAHRLHQGVVLHVETTPAR